MKFLPGPPRIPKDKPRTADAAAPVGMVAGMLCAQCGERFDVMRGALACPECGPGALLEIDYDYEAIGKILTPARLAQTGNRSMWRYLPLLPVRGLTRVPPLEVGATPLLEAPQLARTLGVDRIWIKDEGRNPTRSFEDRALAVAIARAREENFAAATWGGSGEAALSATALAASAGMRLFLFLGQEAESGFIAQLLLTRAEVFVVKGSREEAIALSRRCAEEFGWFYADRAVNPYAFEGMKTIAYEIAEQHHWSVPDYVVVPVGEGAALASLWKGFLEMRRLGWIDRLPKMIGVQAIGASPIYEAWRSGREIVATRPTTLAESLAVGAPRNGRRAIAAVNVSEGAMAAVSDREMLKAMHMLAEQTGVVAEPGSAATLAGVSALLREHSLPRSASIVLVIANCGLRHAPAAVAATGRVRTIPADFKPLRPVIEKLIM